MVPYAQFLNPGDNAWQLTAATLVGLMSIPGLAVLYGGIVQKKWAVNTMMMVFSAFSLTLIVWVLWAFKMGFGTPWIGHFVGKPGTVVGASGEQAQASIPLLKGLMPWKGDLADLTEALVRCRQFPQGIRPEFRARDSWKEFLWAVRLSPFHCLFCPSVCFLVSVNVCVTWKPLE